MKLRIGAMLAAVAVLAGCDGSSSGGGGQTTTYSGTQGPGDVWTWILYGGQQSFFAENETLGYTYEGDYATLPNGFLKLTILSTTEPNMTTPAVAYAVEIPNTALVVKPDEADAQPIVMAALGQCPSQTADYNWVIAARDAWDPQSHEAYGVTTVSVLQGHSLDLEHNQYGLDGSFLGTNTETGWSCQDGLITNTVNPTIVVVSPSGIFVGDNGPNEGGFMGMVAPAAMVDVSANALAGRQFMGFVFREGDSDADTDAMTVVGLAQGGLEATVYSDVEAGTVAETVELSLGAQSTPGIVNGTVNDGQNSQAMVFMISQVGGRLFVFGIADGPSNFIAIER